MPNLLTTTATRDKETESAAIAFSWLLHLRWGAVIAQALLVLAVYFFLALDLPYRIIFAILAFESLSNLVFLVVLRQRSRIADRLFGPVMILDTALLSLLLYYSGGPLNPFSFLYLIHITLGAILMRSSWAWGLAAFTTTCYATLFYLPADQSVAESCHPIPGTNTPLDDPMQIHLQGMWLAFTVTAFFIVFFVSRVRRALAEHEKTVAELATEKGKNEKLASLATLAAGAAHEFSTPLATIAVASSEMLHTLKKGETGPEELADLTEDLSLIRGQVERCKDILYQMAADAGEHLGEELSVFSLKSLLETLPADLPPAVIGRITAANTLPDLLLRMPRRTIGRIIGGLIKNALDASPSGGPIDLSCRIEDQHLLIAVSDRGSGMSQEIAARATEPFFTTKEAGKGLGLGLYLARSAAERLGGGLVIASKPEQGTTVTLSFALEQITAGSSQS